MSNWTWAAAACRGTSHARDNTRRQDAFCCRTTESSALIVAVSDGAGSASRGGEGASLVCRGISTMARAHIESNNELPSNETIAQWLEEIRARIRTAAENRALKFKDFAATLVCVLTHANDTVTIHIGDGSAVAKCASTNNWIALSWPQHGEYASTTFFVTDDELRLSVNRHEEPVSAIAVFSDGIERLALDFATQVPHRPFFDGMLHPLLLSSENGKDKSLSEQLLAYLDSKAVNSRTDDDKTLVLAVNR